MLVASSLPVTNEAKNIRKCKMFSIELRSLSVLFNFFLIFLLYCCCQLCHSSWLDQRNPYIEYSNTRNFDVANSWFVFFFFHFSKFWKTQVQHRKEEKKSNKRKFDNISSSVIVRQLILMWTVRKSLVYECHSFYLLLNFTGRYLLHID